MTDKIIEGLETRAKSLILEIQTTGACKEKTCDLIADLADELKAREWVRIDKVPDEWKDGRPVDLLVLNSCEEIADPKSPLNYSRYRRVLSKGFDINKFDGVSFDYENFEDENSERCEPSAAARVYTQKITHVMLPPSLPKPEGTG